MQKQKAQIQASHNPKVSQGHFGNFKEETTHQSKLSVGLSPVKRAKRLDITPFYPKS